MKKQILSLLSLAFAAITFAGCSGATSSQTSVAPASSVSSTVSSQAASSVKESSVVASSVVSESSTSEAEAASSTEASSLYVFEAEYTNLTGKVGIGYSSQPSGTDLIVPDDYNMSASNGFFLTNMFKQELTIDFVITSSAAAKADLSVRIASMIGLTFAKGDLTVSVNGTSYDVPACSFTYSDPFKDVAVGEIDLVAGENNISYCISNTKKVADTREAYAADFDCLKIDSENATLSWTEITSNLDGKSGD